MAWVDGTGMHRFGEPPSGFIEHDGRWYDEVPAQQYQPILRGEGSQSAATEPTFLQNVGTVWRSRTKTMKTGIVVGALCVAGLLGAAASSGDTSGGNYSRPVVSCTSESCVKIRNTIRSTSCITIAVMMDDGWTPSRDTDVTRSEEQSALIETYVSAQIQCGL